jgi:hypothetical protein
VPQRIGQFITTSRGLARYTADTALIRSTRPTSPNGPMVADTLDAAICVAVESTAQRDLTGLLDALPHGVPLSSY